MAPAQRRLRANAAVGGRAGPGATCANAWSMHDIHRVPCVRRGGGNAPTRGGWGRADPRCRCTRLASPPERKTRTPFTSPPPPPPPPPHSPQDDCANLCIDTAGCSIYQWCGFGSFNGTCAWPDTTKPQAAKGDCLLGNGGWRQQGSARDVGGWTVGTGCSAVDAPPDPETEGEKVDDEPKPVLRAAPVASADPVPPTPKPAAAPLAPRVDAAADKPATVEKPVTPAGWARTADAAPAGGAGGITPLTDVVTPVRTPVARAPAPAGAARPTVAAAAPVDDGMTVVPPKKTTTAAAAPAPVSSAPRKAAAAPAPVARKGVTAAPAPAPAAAAGGKRLAGTALELQPDMTKAECAVLCDGDKACKGWSWCAAPAGCGSIATRVCQPMSFSGPARYVEGDGWTSGLKEAATAAAKSV